MRCISLGQGIGVWWWLWSDVLVRRGYGRAGQAPWTSSMASCAVVGGVYGMTSGAGPPGGAVVGGVRGMSHMQTGCQAMLHSVLWSWAWSQEHDGKSVDKVYGKNVAGMARTRLGGSGGRLGLLLGGQCLRRWVASGQSS